MVILQLVGSGGMAVVCRKIFGGGLSGKIHSGGGRRREGEVRERIERGCKNIV